MAFAHAGLPDKDDVLVATDEVGLRESSICVRGIAGLKFQSKALSGFRSRNLASLMRRSTLRRRRWPA